MQKFDLHMHTTYCDGNNSAEEMILAAIDRGLETVGISGHSFTPHDPSYCMGREATLQYIEDVNSLKAKYSDKIRVLLGLECDLYAHTDTEPYDYLIGSVHYIFTEKGRAKRAEILGKYRASDADLHESDAAIMSALVKYTDWSDVDDEPYDLAYFAKLLRVDLMTVAEMYYESVAEVISETDCDIVGHFDLLTKFNERYRLGQDGEVVDTWDDIVPGKTKEFFDTSDLRYIASWKKAIDRIFDDCAARYENGYRNRLEQLGVLTAGDKPVFEINTGAISRGYRTTPYPAPDQIEYIKSKGGVLILNSDSHSVETVTNRFGELQHLV